MIFDRDFEVICCHRKMQHANLYSSRVNGSRVTRHAYIHDMDGLETQFHSH